MIDALTYVPGYRENTMVVSFDISLSGETRSQGRNGEACPASPMRSLSSLINLISKDTIMVFCLRRKP